MADGLNHCGLCGGGVRLFTGSRYGRPITDWKHTDAPEGTAPHRPVLGRPVDQETLERIHRPREEAPMATAPPVTWETRPCRQQDLPMSAARMLLLAQDHGWTVLQATQTRLSTGQHTVSLAMRRHDVGFAAFWAMKPEETRWKFSDAFTLTSAGVRERVGSNSLREWIERPERVCPVCDRSDITHEDEECPS